MIQGLAQEIIAEAVALHASDLYFLPAGEGNYQIRARVLDQKRVLKDVEESSYQALIGHFKFLAGMNVGEKRRSQMGACEYNYGEGVVSLRLSTVGDFRHRESMVIRLLYPQIEKLRFWFEEDRQVSSYIQQKGLYLFAGPVGSGKTSLMYQLARTVFGQDQILTIEDPVEIRQEEMLQLQLNEAIGLTYDALIKLALRHRPDLLIIGEIRDVETARAVIRASMIGLTVFSTVHAKGVRGVYQRLLELGVSEEELAHGLQGVFYQRLLEGGGVLDVAREQFQTHSSQSWNHKIDRLVEKGILSPEAAAREKIKD